MFKSEFPQVTSSSMLAHMTDNAIYTNNVNNGTTPNTFHNAFCKTGKDPEWIARVSPKTD